MYCFVSSVGDQLLSHIRDAKTPKDPEKPKKGQWQKKSKVDPQLELKSQAAKKIDLTIEEAADDMKLSLWRAMQGIKDEQLLVSVLSRVVAKDLSLEEMVTEFNK